VFLLGNGNFVFNVNLKNAVLYFLAMLVAPAASHSAGFSIFTQGAGPMGVGNASVAHEEGVTSIYYNPALQLEFDSINIEGGVTLLFPQKELNSSVTMQHYESEDVIYLPIHFASSYRISNDSSVAINVNNSFGLGSEFPEDTVFRYIATESSMTTWDINPTFAYRLHETFSLAAGVRFVYVDVSLKQMIPFREFGLSDGRQNFDADGTGYGWNLGAVYSPVEYLSFGASYRSPVDIDLSGDLDYDLPQSGSPLLSTIFPATSARSELSLPGQLFMGIALKPTTKWVVEVAARYEQYSCYDELEVTTAQPVAGQTSRTIPKNWDDVWGYMLGASYQTEAGYRVSAGYLWEENPVPDATFEPTASGLDKQTFTLGLGKQVGIITVRTSYAFDHYKDRDIQNSGKAMLLNGTHSQNNHSLALTLAYRF
jgi:long-chain fatty acid transport protein